MFWMCFYLYEGFFVLQFQATTIFIYARNIKTIYRFYANDVGMACAVWSRII